MPLRSRCFPTGRQPGLECLEVCSQGWKRFCGILIALLDGSKENPISVQKHKRGACRRGSPGLCQQSQEPTGDGIGGLRWSYGMEDALACHPSGSHVSLPGVPMIPDATSTPDSTSTLAIRIRFVLFNVCRGDRFAKRNSRTRRDRPGDRATAGESNRLACWPRIGDWPRFLGRAGGFREIDRPRVVWRQRAERLE